MTCNWPQLASGNSELAPGLLLRKMADSWLCLAAVITVSSPQAIAQTSQNSDSAVGQSGVRQTRSTTLETVEPMARIDSRIQNRVELRISNRLDRDYEVPSTTSSFKTAGEKIKRSNPR